MAEKINVESGNPYRDSEGHFGTSPDEKLKASFAALRSKKLVKPEDNQKKLASAKKDAEAKLAELRGSNKTDTNPQISDYGDSNEQDAHKYIDTYGSSDIADADKINLQKYTMSSFAMVNRSLREGSAFNDKQTDLRKSQIAEVTASMDVATNSSQLKDDLSLYRGASYSSDLKVGGIIEDKAFVSTSIRKQAPMEFVKQAQGANMSAYLIKINAKSGQKGVFVSSVTGNKNYENEFILPKGQSMTITKITQADGYSILEVEL